MRRNQFLLLTLLSLALFQWLTAAPTELWREGINLIPAPQEVSFSGADFILDGPVSIILDSRASEADRFAAQDLASRLEQQWGVKAGLGKSDGAKIILLTRKGIKKKLPAQGYEFLADGNQITIRAGDDPGIFYGSRTLLQVIKQGQAGTTRSTC